MSAPPSDTQDPRPSGARPGRSALLALATFGVFTAVALWCVHTALPRWNEAYVGRGELEGWLWRYWWMKQLITAAWNAASAKYALYVALVSGSYPETGNVLDLQLLSLPLDALLGSPAYYNTKVVIVLALNGLAGYALARLLIDDWAASVLCGFAFAFGTYVLLEIETGRIRQAVIFPLALYMYALMRMSASRASLAWAALAGLAFGFCASSFLFYGMSAAFVSALWLVWLGCPEGPAPDAEPMRARAAARWRLAYITGTLLLGFGLFECMVWRVRPLITGLLFAAAMMVPVVLTVRRDGWRRLAQLAIVLAIGVAASMPYATWYIEQAFVKRQPLPETTWHRPFPPLEELESPHNAHVCDDILANSMQRFRGDSFSWDYPFLPSYRRAVPLALTVLALGGLLAFRRRPWLFVAIMGLGYILSLGPYLKGGVTEEFVARPDGMKLLQAYFFEYVPYFARLFSPIRMQGLFLLGFSVLVGWSAAMGFRRLRLSQTSRVAFAATIIALSLWQIERAGVIPIATTPLQVPDVYPWIAESDADGIIEIPLREGDYANYYQMFHGKRVLDGWAAGSVPDRFPKSRTRWLAQAPSNTNLQNTFLAWLRALNEGESSDRARAFEPADLKAIASMGYRYALLHERGCYIVKGPEGRSHYLFMRRMLDGLLGGPVRTSYERVCEGWANDATPDDDGLYRYEIVVYDLKPLVR